MSNGKNPLMLMMALSMPGAANALGLGEIHVDSALNERFAAEIDIVGATEVDLTDLRAAIANRETFLHYGADRPGFLGYFQGYPGQPRTPGARGALHRGIHLTAGQFFGERALALWRACPSIHAVARSAGICNAGSRRVRSSGAGRT